MCIGAFVLFLLQNHFNLRIIWGVVKMHVLFSQIISYKVFLENTLGLLNCMDEGEFTLICFIKRSW